MTTKLTRAIGYGRLSFDDPDRRTSSVEDQEAAARRYAEQHGFAFLGFYADHGITGATMERPRLQMMLGLVRANNVDVLIIEDVDRLSRDQEHLQYMAKLLRAHGVILHTVAVGAINELVLSVKGIVAEDQRRRTAYQTRRGLKGKAHRAGATGGKTLGFERAITGQDARGAELDRYIIIEREAALVRRIFTLYDEGHSLKSICDILDSEGVPPPSASWQRRNSTGRWNPSTLSGNVERCEGILNNRAYIGERIFNRRTWIEVPNERRGFSRQPRLNDQSEWIVGNDPEQRVVDQALWDRVKARQQQARAARDEQFRLTANPIAGAKRPKHLLSEMVHCGSCGDLFIASGAGRWRCRSHRRGTCVNGSVTTAELEERVLCGVRQRLLSPALIARFAAELQHELDAAYRTSNDSRGRIEIELTDARNRISKLVRRMEEDDDPPRALLQRLKELEATENRLADQLETEPTRTAIRLPVNYEVVYRQAIGELDVHLASDEGGAAREALRSLVERVVVQPGDARGGKRRPIQLHGDLFGMLAFAEGASRGKAPPRAEKLRSSEKADECVIPVVAGTGFEPVTFRL